MSFHEHSPGYCLLVVRQYHLYSHDSLCQCKHLVDTHVYFGKFQQAFQFLVYLQGYEADADVSFDSSAGEVEHRTYLDFGLGYAECPLHMP